MLHKGFSNSGRIVGLFRVVAAGALVATVSFIGAGVDAGASTTPSCTSTNFWQDGIDLTAAQIGGSVTGDLNASGCNIGVYNPSSVSNATISGLAGETAPNYYGILVNGQDSQGTSANVVVSDSQISGVGELPENGAQHGVAIAFINGASGTVSSNVITGYQKGGVVVKSGSSVNVLANEVVGLGPVDFIAQNGIEFFNASGVVRGNLIADNYYTACPIPLANSTGSCTDWVSTGILLYSVVPSAVKVSENFFRGDQRNQYLIPA